MTEPNLADYIMKARSAGKSDGETRDLLYKNGWTAAEVDAAIFSIEHPGETTKPPLQAPEHHHDPGAEVSNFDQFTQQENYQVNIANKKNILNNKNNMNKTIVSLLMIILVIASFIAGFFVSSYVNPLGSENRSNSGADQKNVKSVLNIPAQIQGTIYDINNRKITVISNDSVVYVVTPADNALISSKGPNDIKSVQQTFSYLKQGQQVTVVPEKTYIENVNDLIKFSSILVVAGK